MASLSLQPLPGNSFFLTFVSSGAHGDCDANNCQVTTLFLRHWVEVTAIQHRIAVLFVLFSVHFSYKGVVIEVWLSLLAVAGELLVTRIKLTNY